MLTFLFPIYYSEDFLGGPVESLSYLRDMVLSLMEAIRGFHPNFFLTVTSTFTLASSLLSMVCRPLAGMGSCLAFPWSVVYCAMKFKSFSLYSLGSVCGSGLVLQCSFLSRSCLTARSSVVIFDCFIMHGSVGYPAFFLQHPMIYWALALYYSPRLSQAFTNLRWSSPAQPCPSCQRLPFVAPTYVLIATSTNRAKRHELTLLRCFGASHCYRALHNSEAQRLFWIYSL